MEAGIVAWRDFVFVVVQWGCVCSLSFVINKCLE